MRVPKKFKIFAKEYEVIYDNDKCADKKVWGAAEYRENVIYLCDKNGGVELNPETIYHTFLHEVVHVILFESGLGGYIDDNDLEHFVDLFANCLHQVLKTAE